MATIVKVPGKATKYRAQIRKRGFAAASKTFPTKKAAADWVKEQDALMTLDQYTGKTEADQHTLTELIALYKEQTSPTDKKMSYLKWWDKKLGHMILANIEPADISAQLRSMKAGNKKAGGKNIRNTDKKYAQSTINRYHSAMNSVFTFANAPEVAWMKNHPGRFTQPAENNVVERWLKDEEKTDLLAACEKSEWKGLIVLVHLALATGLRQSNLLELSWKDVDLKAGTLYVGKTKNDSPIMQPVMGEALVVLKKWNKVRRIDSALVFPSKAKPSKPFTFRKSWDKAVADSGIVAFRFHDLRHSCGTYLAQANVNQAMIMSVLGHKTLQASQRYMHLGTDDKAAALAKVFGN